MSLASDLIYGAAAVVSSPVWGWRLWRTGKWRTDWAGRFGRCHLPPAKRPRLLIHAVSVGEVGAIRLLMRKLEQEHADDIWPVISATTDTGHERARELFAPQHPVVRYPLDFTRCVRRFLDEVRPSAVALVELEVWPTFVAECARRKIPVMVLNGRLSERSFELYRKVRPLVRGAFRRLACVAAQEEVYARRFVELGTDERRVEVVGNMKWDTAQIVDDVEGSKKLASALGINPHLPLIVCGSTGPGEEAMMVEQLADLTGPGDDGEVRRVQLLIAPRKPERFRQVAAEIGNPIRRSRCPDGGRRQPDRNRLFLLDTMGELRKAYALADVVVVGRSFCPLHGSDMIEPIALGKPTVIGPNVDDFRDIAERLVAGGGLVKVEHRSELREAVAGLLRSDRGREAARRGREVIRRQMGVTDRHVAIIERVMAERGARSAAPDGTGRGRS